MRDIWQSRTSFVLASIGSAIGLGNIWRFPYICYANGGGAFLIPYLVALFTAGIPLMILEFSLGHYFEAPAPMALGKVRKPFEILGWFALLVGFGICTYYAVVMGWCFDYLGLAVKKAWGEHTQEFFFNEFLKISQGPLMLGSIRGWIVLGLVLSWIWIIACIWKGPTTVGKVVYFTVTIPWIILIIFVIRGITLPGAIEGLKFYLTPNFSKLLDYKVWLNAYSQVFFSLTIGFGVQITYASFLPKKADIVNNAFLVSLADAATAFIGGFAVFSTLGYYALKSGLPVDKVVASGPQLAFVTYPTIINLLPIGSVIFGILFFIMLLTLGIDSAFSLVEAGAAGIKEKFNLNRTKVNIGFGVIALVIGLIYTTNGGLYWLDIVDYFMNNFGLMIVALLQCVLVGYFYSLKELRHYANNQSDFSIGIWWDFCIKILTPVVVLFLVLSNIIDRIKTAYGNYPRIAEFLGGWLLVIIFIITAIILYKQKHRSAQENPK
ncbi:MAG: sodium-dependent transporter [candidate division WOR-3 bacterium]|nr:sodium-dependent transporter [candidate division WOR-3 bacterium]